MKILLFDLLTSGHHISYISYLNRYLCEKGHEVMLVTLKEDSRIKLLKQDEPNLAVKYVSSNINAKVKRNLISRHIQMIGSLKKCFQIADAWNADIVHVLYLDYNELPLYLQRFYWRKHAWHLFAILVAPYFSYDKDEKVNFLQKLYHSLKVAVLKRMLEKGVLSSLFVHTVETKKLLSRRFGWQSRYLERIVVVPDPLEISYGRCSEEVAREKLGLPKGIPILLFFGELRWSKGLDLLLEAIEGVRQDFNLLIAGLPADITQSDVNTYKKHPDGSSKIIDRLEYIPEEDIGYYFLSADVVVLPYRKATKGTSGVLQHTCGAGKSVIATDVGQIGRIVKEHSLGIVVEPESVEALREGIQRFLNDRGAIMDTGVQNALHYAKENHWRKMAAGVEATYQSCGVAIPERLRG